jgi:hypothetical protein
MTGPIVYRHARPAYLTPQAFAEHFAISTTAEYPAYDGSQVCATVDPEEFHPELGERTDAAKRICKGDPDRGTAPCVFLDPCLQYALHHRVSGVWGGTSG